jgi:hypothetical protein
MGRLDSRKIDDQVISSILSRFKGVSAAGARRRNPEPPQRLRTSDLTHALIV